MTRAKSDGEKSSAELYAEIQELKKKLEEKQKWLEMVKLRELADAAKACDDNPFLRAYMEDLENPYA